MPGEEKLNFASKFFLLSIAVLFFIYFSASLVKKGTLTNIVFHKPQVLVQAPTSTPISLTLLGPKAVNNNDNFEVLVKVDTNNQPIQAIDVVLSFDSKQLELVEFKPNHLFFSHLPFKQANNHIYFSALATDNQDFTGSGEIAVLSFKAKAGGKTDLNLVFSPSQTTDSNVVLWGETDDALTKVNNLSVNVL